MGKILFYVLFCSTQDRHKIFESLLYFASNLMSIEKKMSHDEVLLSEMGGKIIQKIARKIYFSGPTILQLLSDKILSGGSSVSQFTGNILLIVYIYSLVLS